MAAGMSDIFISYAGDDRQRVAVLAKALESAGYSVWWDRSIPTGVTFGAYIDQHLSEARCVIVAWSETSITSHWVTTEAGEARQRGILIPVLIDDVDPPLGFGLVQAAKLMDWKGDSHHPEWRRVLGTIALLITSTDPDDPGGRGIPELMPTQKDSAQAPASPDLGAAIPDAVTEATAITVDVIEGDALTFAADVLALKHAGEAFHGIDKAVATRYLDKLGLSFPVPGHIGDGVVFESRGCVASDRLLVVGVPNLFEFGHREIRRFVAHILGALHRQPEPTRHLALTIHGAALRLDPSEVFETQLGGLIDALDDDARPVGLERISFVERNHTRAAKLQAALQRVLPTGEIPLGNHPAASVALPHAADGEPPTDIGPFEPYRGPDPYLFISYAHADSSQVFRHLSHLDNLGYRIWYDAGIDPGTNWEDSIATAIESSDQMLVYVTPRSVASQHVRDEISFALNKKKRFLAAHLEETQLPPGLELRIGSQQAIMLYKEPEETSRRMIERALTPDLRGQSGPTPGTDD